MKKIVFLLLLSACMFQPLAYDKKSLVERFTNASCAPCASINNSWYNTTTGNLVAAKTISHVIYNGWWPGPNDPMYLLNQSDNTARINYYGVNAVPWIVVSGSTVSTSQTAVLNSVNSDNMQYSPFFILVSQEEFSQSLIKYKVQILRDPNDNTTFGNIKLRIALTESRVVFASPPGSNGESVFHNVARKMLPDAGGTIFNIPEPGGMTEINLEYIPTSQFISSVNFDSIKVVAFIQDDNTKYVYQSFTAEDYSSIISEKSQDIMSTNNSVSEFNTQVLNTGLLDDSYQIQINMNAPLGWTGEYTTVNGTYPFDENNIVIIPAGSTSDVSLIVNPNGIDGFGLITVQFISQNDPEVYSVSTLRTVTTTGVDLLVVDASGDGYGELIYNSINSFYEGTLGIVTNQALESPEADLSNYYLVAWPIGSKIPVLNNDEVTLLQNFLDQDGRLLITGQDIGADIFEAGGQTQFAQNFYNNYLHANYVADFGGSFFLTGISGDPVSDSLAFPLNNLYVRSPDEISAFDTDATPIIKFGSTAKYAGIRAANEDHRVIYFSFGVEQIDDEAVRDNLISRSVNWLMDGITVGVDDNDPVIAYSFSLNQNYPNPFNPSTNISYSIPHSGFVSLKIYDVLGKEIKTLVNTNQPSGYYEIEFNSDNLASGIYFYKLQAGESLDTKKMILLK